MCKINYSIFPIWIHVSYFRSDIGRYKILSRERSYWLNWTTHSVMRIMCMYIIHSARFKMQTVRTDKKVDKIIKLTWSIISFQSSLHGRQLSKHVLPINNLFLDNAALLNKKKINISRYFFLFCQQGHISHNYEVEVWVDVRMLILCCMKWVIISKKLVSWLNGDQNDVHK